MKPVSSVCQGSAVRARGWDLPAGRAFPITLNTCVLRVTAAHVPLLRRWQGLLVGPYRLMCPLGRGGVGIVYLAHDDELQRRVAIKVPQAHRIRSPKDAEAYLVEARILATLDHSHIVPVYDVGRSENGLPFIVSKFIETLI